MRKPKSYRGLVLSSTFIDLEEHRKALIALIHDHGSVANAMEFTGARADGDVLDASLRLVRDSVANIGIISQKYGQIPHCQKRNPKQLSITELEFNEAVRLKRPILLFVMSRSHLIREEDVEKDRKKRAKLDAFRQRAKLWRQDRRVDRVYQDFSSLDEFCKGASIAIGKLVALVGQKSPRVDTRSKRAKQPVRSARKDTKKFITPPRFRAIRIAAARNSGSTTETSISGGKEKSENC